MLWKGFAFDHFWNGEPYQVINYRTHNILTFLSLTMIGMWRLMSYRKEYLWQRSGLEYMANFYKVIRNLKLNFTHHFVALLEHFIIIPFLFAPFFLYGTDLYLDCVENFLSFIAKAEKIGHCVTHWILFCSLARKN